MGRPIFRTTLVVAALLAGLSATPAAFAGESHAYPQTVSGWTGESDTHSGSSEREWSSEQDGSAQYGATRHHEWRGERRDIEVQGDDEVGYLPVSFFGDAGGVGPYPEDFGGGGGGGGFVLVDGGGFAGARASASASASVSAFVHASIGFRGGFRGHGGGYSHGGGGHGCGCK